MAVVLIAVIVIALGVLIKKSIITVKPFSIILTSYFKFDHIETVSYLLTSYFTAIIFQMPSPLVAFTNPNYKRFDDDSNMVSKKA